MFPSLISVFVSVFLRRLKYQRSLIHYKAVRHDAVVLRRRGNSQRGCLQLDLFTEVMIKSYPEKENEVYRITNRTLLPDTQN